MKKVYKFKELRKLQIGFYYDFLFIKEIQLPNGIEYYIMQDCYGEKHLLPAKFYKNYNIILGNYYSCKVDKVNCQGKMFFEPKHPLYVIGNEYLFGFYKIDFVIKKDGQMTEYFIMKGESGELAYLDIESSPRPLKGRFIKYKVISIKKAKIFIQKL